MVSRPYERKLDASDVKGERSTKRRKTAPKVTLRGLARCDRLFWPEVPAAFFGKQWWDINFNGLDRQVPSNEVACMALNEVAIHRAYGFFYYLPCREYWRTPERPPMLPKERAPPTTDSSYATLLFVRHAWDEKACKAYLEETQRGRYLKCHAVINPPAGLHPVYAFQYVDWGGAMIYATLSPTLVILQATDTFYLLTTNSLEAVMGRMWAKAKRKPEGKDPEMRIATPRFLWSDNERSADDDQAYEALQQYRHASVDQLYASVLGACQPLVGQVSATFPASHISSIVPRPPMRMTGILLGSSEAPSTQAQSCSPWLGGN